MAVDVMPDGVTYFGCGLPFVDKVWLFADKRDSRICFGQREYILVIQASHAVGMRLAGPRFSTPFRSVDLHGTEYLQ